MLRFVDTNVLLYAVLAGSEPSGELAKAARAERILESSDLCLSTQVLTEFFVQSTRVSRAGRLSPDVAEDMVRALMRFPLQAVTSSVVLAAITSSQRWQISYWDAAIIEAARELGAATVLSEDLQDGMDFAGVRVENPFA